MYQGFAGVYDEFMQNIPADTWADYVEKLWNAHDLKPELVLDLACGTGSLTLELSKRGYDMIGSDMSAEMLNIAREKAMSDGLSEKVLFLLQDMREFELFGTVQCILSTCDSMNYLLKEEEVRKVFELCENYLDPGGLLMFDMNTEYKYKELLGDRVFADKTEDAAFIWQNTYYPEDKINEYDVTFFRKENGENSKGFLRKKKVLVEDKYIRFSENHLQKAYDKETVIRLLEEAHLKVEGVYDAFTLDEAREDSERITFVAREVRKVPGDPAFRRSEAEEDQ